MRFLDWDYKKDLLNDQLQWALQHTQEDLQKLIGDAHSGDFYHHILTVF